MKHAKKYLAGVLSVIIAVAAFPVTTHAAGTGGTDKSNSVTVDGVNYSISQTNQTVQVTARQKGKIIDSCTAYLDQGYMVCKSKETTKAGVTISSVSWLDELIKEAAPSQVSRMAAPAYSTWTKDGKYIYNPSLISMNPITYKEHTAYYWFKNVGTDDDVRTLYISKGTKITLVVALITSLISTVATNGLTAPETFAVATALGIGSGELAKGIVARTISPTVKVWATNYESKFTDSSGAGVGTILHGSKIIVSDPESKYYKKVFYEKYCPQLSRNFDWPAYMYTFKGSYYRYPGLKSYVEL